MTQKRLRMSVSARQMPTLTVDEFLWRPPPEPSSFRTDISPGLDELPGANRRNIEFLRVAALAYLADRTTPRPGRLWARTLDLDVPVWDPAPWNAVANDLAQLFGFLTADRWTLSFRRGRTPRPTAVSASVLGGVTTTLFSGGADSLAAAILFHDDIGSPPILVSHRDNSTVQHAQDALAEELRHLWGTDPPRFSVGLGRNSTQIGSALSFGEELSSRSRSLLFLGLGLAVASVAGVGLRIPENGFASLNPPMGGERRSALSTRTTHPWYLSRLSQILGDVGAHGRIENPFADATKGEMFSRVVAVLGSDEASRLLSESRSCARGGDLRFAGVKGATHCGVCFGCLVRRAAFLGASLVDRTTYAVDDLEMPLGSLAHGWYGEKRARDLQAARYAATQGVDAGDIVRSLPPNVDSATAIGVAQRGLTEIGRLVL